MGAPKATASLRGSPLIAWPLQGMRDAGLDAVVVAKRGSHLPPLEVPVWIEPDEPSHPLTGIVAALEQGRRPLVVCGCDLPFVPAALLAALASHEEALVVVEAGGRLHPLLGRYDPRLAADLREARDGQRSMHAVVGELGGILLDAGSFGDPERVTFNVNTAADLRRAEALA
jgi:molybdopterin-guanine dinucleotide biosynthesis protein A